METKRSIRKSNYDDYIAIDLVNDKSEIIETPLYITKGESKKVKVKDEEEKRYYSATVTFIGNGKIKVVCSDGLSWVEDDSQLLSKDYKY